MENKDLNKVLTQSEFSIVNRNIIKAFNSDCALFLGALVFKAAGIVEEKLTDDGFFYCTIENMEDMTALSKHKQQNAYKKLSKAGLIDVDIRLISIGNDITRTRFFRLNLEKITSITEKKKPESSNKISKGTQLGVGENFAHRVGENNRVGENFAEGVGENFALSKKEIKNTRNNKEKEKKNSKEENLPILDNLDDSKNISNDGDDEMLKQKGLFIQVPLVQDVNNLKFKKAKNAKEKAISNISLARTGSLDWASIKPREFAFYYASEHNRVLGKALENRAADLKPILEDQKSISLETPKLVKFIEMNNIPQNNVVQVLDFILERSASDIDNLIYWKQVSFNALASRKGAEFYERYLTYSRREKQREGERTGIYEGGNIIDEVF